MFYNLFCVELYKLNEWWITDVDEMKSENNRHLQAKSTEKLFEKIWRKKERIVNYFQIYFFDIFNLLIDSI